MNVSCSRSFCNQLSTLSLLVYLLVIFLTQRIFSILVIDVHYSHVCLSKVSACNIDALLNLQRCVIATEVIRLAATKPRGYHDIGISS